MRTKKRLRRAPLVYASPWTDPNPGVLGEMRTRKVQAVRLYVNASEAYTWHIYVTCPSLYEIKGEDDRAKACYGTAMDIQNRIVSAQWEQSVTHAMDSYYQNEAMLEHEKGRYGMTPDEIICLHGAVLDDNTTGLPCTGTLFCLSLS